MAAAAGLVLLAVAVTVLHFVIVLGFTPLASRLNARLAGSDQLHVTYQEGRGVLSNLLETSERHGWQLTAMAADPGGAPPGVTMTLTGSATRRATWVLGKLDGVTAIKQLEEDME